MLRDCPNAKYGITVSGRCRYQTKELIVTENGFSVKGEASKALADVLDDTERVAFYRGYVNAAIDAVEQDQVPCCSSC